MEKILLITQVTIAVLLMVLILTQNKEGGLGAVMGGSQSFRPTRRGAEKVIFMATIVLSTLFLVNAALFAVI